jgi:hypothetical protein
MTTDGADAGFDVSCVAHVHSTYSDGTATVSELLDAARAAGVDALLLTDHDTLRARDEGWEGAHGGVFLLVGSEVTWAQGHYLAFGIDEEVDHAGSSARDIAAAVRSAGGVGIAAHPFSLGGSMLVPPLARRIVLPHGWPGLDEPDGFDGVELWSLTTDAAEGWRTPAEAVRWLWKPEATVANGPPVRHLRRWDELSAGRRVPAIGGLDDHAPGVRVRGRVLSPLSHARTFRLLRTHLICGQALSGDADSDRATLITALAAGAAWLHCPFVAPAAGARFWAERGGDAPIAMGDEGPAGPVVLRAELPRVADVKVICDGSALRELHSARVELHVDRPGVYRLEARIDGRFWLLSNPVHLR